MTNKEECEPYNKWRELISKEGIQGLITIEPENPEDLEIAAQLSALLNYCKNLDNHL